MSDARKNTSHLASVIIRELIKGRDLVMQKLSYHREHSFADR